ncbi:MAG TPA: hydrogenase maturation nickel metallochaperone HypA [Gaiellales bacterium]|jgi:hydrogenase nickel incorporation protein HypA/HybF
MHELSVARAVIATATRHAEGRRVTVVQLRVGHLRQVVPDSLAFAFVHVAVGTLCEGARLEQEVVPARLECAGCGLGWELDEAMFRCPRCGSAGVRITAGDELLLESIEVADEEDACIAPR